MDFDVIVVGGGPAASGAATHVRKQDRTVMIIAKKRRHGPRTEVICPDVKQELQLFGLARDVIPALGRVCHAISASWGAPTPFVQSFFGHPYGDSLIVERQSFDTRLLQFAVAAGARVVDGTFGGAVHDGIQWRVTCHDASGAHVFTSRLLVDATGRSAAVARTIGSVPILCDRLIGISAVIPQSSPSLLQVIASREGWWYAIPLVTGETFACLITDADIARDLNATTISDWMSLARRALPEQPQTRPATLGVYACHSAVLQHMGEHWLAVGDAAASYDPLSAVGVLHALRSARCAANAITRLLDGDTRSLGSYAAQERHAFVTYLHHRAKQYGLERRFSDQPFWERRNRIPMMAAGI